jgi:hypothetical protein
MTYSFRPGLSSRAVRGSGGSGFEQGLADAHDGAAAHLAFGGLAVQGLSQSQHAPPIRAGAHDRLRQPLRRPRPAVPEAHKEPPW